MLIYNQLYHIYLLITFVRNEDLRDYKFFCFNGYVKFFKIDYGRFTDHHANYYDRYGSLLPFGETDFSPNPDADITVPDNLEEMIRCAEKISKWHTFLRVDLYSIGGKIYFGETTFYPASGLGRFTPPEWDEKIGLMLKLPMQK